MNQWLVRTAKNWVAGPYSKDQVCKMVTEGKLTSQDEVCPANGYWIYLHEADEVKKQLGINPPVDHENAEEEITETQTDLDEQEHTDPDIQVPQTATMKAAIPDGDAPDATTVISRQSLTPKPAPRKAAPARRRVETMGSMEGPSLWRMVAWVLVLVAGIIGFTLVRLLKH